MTPLWACQCSRERVSQALVALGAEELRQIVADQQSEQVRCEFCATEYMFTPQELVQLLHEALAAEQRTPHNV
jgi:molecular chaperone Hsp33